MQDIKIKVKQLSEVKRENYTRGLKAGLIIGISVAVLVFVGMAHIIIALNN